MKWKTATGEKIDIKDMTTSHIENCIKMLNKGISDFDFELIGMDEHGFGGGITAMNILEEMEKWERQVKVFEKELERRNHEKD